MAKTGRPSVPTALKILRGNPGRRPLNPREAKLPAEIPAAPAHLDPVARAEWDRIVQHLAAAGLLTVVDRGNLTGYCMAWGTVVDAGTKLKDSETSMVSDKGIPYLNPEISRLNAALKQLREFGAEFGMSPASRSRIKVDEPVKEGELQAFQRRHLR